MRSNRQLYRVKRKILLFALTAMELFAVAFCPTAFAAQLLPDSSSGTQPGLLRASVSVVRLLVTYEKADDAELVYCTGLGTIVASWPSQNASDQNSWVLTDSSLVNWNEALCANGHPQATLKSIEVYLSMAYNPQAMNFPSSIGSVTCQDKDCHSGSALFALDQTQGQLLPFIDLAQPQSKVDQETAIALTANADQGSTSSSSLALPLLTPSIATTNSSDASKFQTQVEKSLTPDKVLPTSPFEAGTPFINSNGQLMSLHLAGTSSKPTTPSLQSFITQTLADLQSPLANQAHDGWQNGIDAYINKDFSKAHAQFQIAAHANPSFQAAKDLAVSSLNSEKNANPNQSSPSNPITIAGVSITLWQLVIAIVLLLAMVLLMITLLLGRSRRRSLKADLLEANRQATSEAQQIAEMKVTQRAKAQKLLDEQPMHPSLVLVPAQSAASRLPCPRCGELVPRDANYCSNCRLMLSPPRASVHLPIPPQMATRSIVPSPSMPQLPIVAPVPVVSPAASSQTESIEELKTPPDKKDVQIEVPSKKSISKEQSQSNPVERISKLINRRLGNYRLIRLLGNGGFADVYLGEHVYLKKHAAIKVQHIRLTKEAIKGFLDEARTIAGLDHPHIIRVLDFGVEGEELDLEQSMLNVEGSTPFLVMDYASGGSLRQRHPKGSRLSLDTVISYIGQVAEALQYAHQKRLIHRDIKPENMLIGSHDEILLSDFGIAVVAHSEHSMTTQQMAGTLPYMAPEQIQRKPQPASDQYSLGIIVYEWLSGSRPFQGSSEWEIMNQHLFSPPPSLRENNPTIPQEVEQVVLKALSKDLRQRFASVADFARALASAR